MPRVSVIVPAYNAAAVITQALDSVVAQTYEDWEAIVADDGSSDETAALSTGRDPRISCVRSPHNLGIGGARNLALTHATGELVALLDADDVWLPDYLQRMLAEYDATVARGANVGIVCCDAYEFGPEGLRERRYSDRVGWVADVTLASLLHRNTIFVSALLPRQVIDEVSGFATDCLGTEDYDMWLRVLETGRHVVALREPLVMYRVAASSLSANRAVMARAAQATYRHALSRGRLTAQQRRIARRELRLQRCLEQWAETVPVLRRRGFPASSIGRVVVLGAWVALERPRRWPHWLIAALRVPLRAVPR
ncbi:MAG TPA: glycosyltransferase family 2 protein [Solirubrobacteraceae bacterium]|jgi:glycosyltransferase involved in cell wall biosynthesis|nr:glycosyltransferase family 2 protein [Solirubrobacteraceae bacterium]